MKKLLLLLALLPASVFGFAAGKNALRVQPVVGEAVTFMFDAEPEVNFTSTGVSITATGAQPVSFAFDDIESLDFPEINAVQQIDSTQGIKVSCIADAIVISNAPEQSTLEVYSIDGRKIISTVFSGDFSISRDSFAKGINIIKVNNSAFKILI